MAAFFSAARLMLKVAWPGALRLECQGEDGSVAGNARAAGRARGRKLQDADHAIVTVYQRHRLPILRQQCSVGNIHQLQYTRVVRDLHGNGKHVLAASHVHVHRERGADYLIDVRRIKAYDGTARRRRGRDSCPAVAFWLCAADWPAHLPGRGILPCWLVGVVLLCCLVAAGWFQATTPRSDSVFAVPRRWRASVANR